MSAQERLYRALLVAFPRRHRDEYAEPMVQLMRDRLRDEGGGFRTGLVWLHLLVDLVRSAVDERLEHSMDTLRTGWWRLLAAVIGVVVAAAATQSLLEGPAESWYKHAFGTAALVAGPVATAVGLAVWRRHRRIGDVLVALGVLPGCAAIVLFWHPLFLGFGLLSFAVLVAAVDDHERVQRVANAADLVAGS